MRTDSSNTVNDRSAPPLNATAERLLSATSALMIERNTIDVSLSELAQKSGVNAALVKYHFGNKDGLLLALLARDSASEMANLAYLLKQPITATEKLRLHIAGIINAYYRFPYMNRLIHLLLHEGGKDTAREVNAFFVKPLFEFQRGLLLEGIAAGEFRKVDPALFYTSLVGACDHLFSGRLMSPLGNRTQNMTDDMRVKCIAHVTELFLGGLLEPKAKANFKANFAVASKSAGRDKRQKSS